MKQKVVGLFSVAGVIGFGAWFYSEPGYEPALGFIAGVGVLISSFWRNPVPKDYDDSYVREVGAIEARWKAEQKLRPASVENARWILSELLSVLHRVRALKSTEKQYAELDELIYQVKEAQSIEMYMDGGESYGRFWASGTSVFDNTSELLKKI